MELAILIVVILGFGWVEYRMRSLLGRHVEHVKNLAIRTHWGPGGPVK